MPRFPLSLLTLVLAAAMSACAPPPPALTAPEEALVRRCLELAYKHEPNAECAEQVTKPMEKAFLEKHPDFYAKLLADRKAFVEARIAEEMRRRDELSQCLDDREASNPASRACDTFMPHEIARAIEDRRRTRCAQGRLDSKADALHYCEGLSDRDIKDEMQMERVRRENRR